MIKVIVAITTYNLEKYIEQALDSVLMQKTNFDYKIIVADDASVDNTVNILRKYKEKYPNKIDIILNEKNIGSLATSNKIFNGIDCEYFSFLDGDDYWLDVDRLQRQVDFMDSHKDYTLYGGNTQYLVGDKLGELIVKSSLTNKTYEFADYLNDKMPFVHTSSLLVRNCIFKNGLPSCYLEVVDTFENCALRGEDFRRILHLEKGKMYLSSDVISVYRIHSQGVWQGSSNIRKSLETAIGYNFYDKYFNNKYGLFFHKKLLLSYKSLMKQLVINYDFLNNNNLGEKDSKLLTDFLFDIRKKDIPDIKNKSRLKKFIYKVFFKLFV